MNSSLQSRAMSFISTLVNTRHWNSAQAYNLVREMMDAKWNEPDITAAIDRDERAHEIERLRTALERIAGEADGNAGVLFLGDLARTALRDGKHE